MDMGYITISMVDGSAITLENRTREDFRELHEWQLDIGGGLLAAKMLISGKVLHSITREHVVKISFYPNQEN